MHYNGFLTAEINGAAAPGYSSGQAMAALEEVARTTLPREISYDWSELSFQERRAEGTARITVALPKRSSRMTSLRSPFWLRQSSHRSQMWAGGTARRRSKSPYRIVPGLTPNGAVRGRGRSSRMRS